jgi:hypothetical protein
MQVAGHNIKPMPKLVTHTQSVPQVLALVLYLIAPTYLF